MERGELPLSDRQLSPIMEMSPIDGGAPPLPQTNGANAVGDSRNDNMPDLEEFRKQSPFHSSSLEPGRRSSKRDVASWSFVALVRKLWKPVLAEFIATALYLCTGITTVIDTEAKVFPVAVGHAMFIFMIVASFGPVRQVLAISTNVNSLRNYFSSMSRSFLETKSHTYIVRNGQVTIIKYVSTVYSPFEKK